MKNRLKQIGYQWAGIILIAISASELIAQTPLPLSPPVPPNENSMSRMPVPETELPSYLAEQHIQPYQPRHVRDYSWIYIDPAKPRVIKVHDLITIVVDEKSEVTVKSRFNRQRRESLKAELREFMRISENGNLTSAAQNSQPTIDATLSGRLQSNGDLIDTEGVRYRIAATVVDVLPNGNLVLEARKSIRSNKDVWEHSLTGILRSKDVNRDNTALSENIANLIIEKRQRGKVYDSTKRPWGVRLYDFFSPF